MQDVGASEKPATLETKEDPSIGAGDTGTEKSKQDVLRENRLPREPITTKTITWEQAQQLATTRHRRYSDTAIAGLIATLPGTAQTVVEYMNAAKPVVPSIGRLVELIVFIIFATLTVASLFKFGESTSKDILARVFPEMTEQTGLIKRVRRRLRKLGNDLTGPLE
jgi:hypothetical protein